MTALFNAIHWNFDPIAHLGSFNNLHWYGILFSFGVIGAYLIVGHLYKREGIDDKYLSYLLLFVVGFAVVGARLGEVFFYNWDYYKDHLDEIYKTWEGGLASHGATIGIFIAVFIKKPFLWVADIALPGVACTAAFIRLGNFANSEIIGKASNLPWAVYFDRLPHPINLVARHPSQLYEAAWYFALSALLIFLYRKYAHQWAAGTISGIFLLVMFVFRFCIEFVKEDQVAFEAGQFLNQGQRLSIPFILIGIVILVIAMRKKPETKM
jgi:phosphatidylglycerol---prolipoprotein diacylglyceryl transferase